MRALAAPLLAFALAGCIVVPARHYPPGRPPPPGPPPSAAPAPPAPRLLSQAEAIDLAFRHARERGLRVDRVKKAHLDSAGRWHVDLRGNGDKARVLLDARDGRLLRANLKDD